MNWIFHDSYETDDLVQAAGADMINLGLAKAVKIIQKGKKSRPYMLFIIPLKLWEVK
jgi:hypothetical protein